MSAARQFDNLTLETIEAALFSISADLSRDQWARIGMALKSELGEAGWPLFDAWSKTDARSYNAKDCADTWKSIRPDGGVNIATLIWEAQQAGWTFDDDRPRLDAAQVEQRRAEREAERKAAEADKRRAQGEAAKLANLTWDAATPASDAHPYLQAKRVRAHGLGIGEWPLVNDKGEVWCRVPDALLIPILDANNGKIISLQGIYPDDTGEICKRYLKHGRKRGGFHMVGTPPDGSGQPLVLCEGYATGATIHQLTGWPVVVCFDAPNVPVVAEAMRTKFPKAAFVIAADNDQFTTKPDGTPVNPGMNYAQRAAQATGGCVIAPQFADLSTQPTDFNDLAALEGDQVAHAQLLANPVTALAGVVVPGAPATAPANDNASPRAAAVEMHLPLPFGVWPDTGDKGQPLNTLENLDYMLRAYGVIVRYNVIRKAVEIIVPGTECSPDNAQKVALARVTSLCGRNRLPKADLDQFLFDIADRNQFNPALAWIESAPWDGTSRLDALFATVEPEAGFDITVRNLLLRRWLISAVAAISMPGGFRAKGVLVFSGRQSVGKTAWFMNLLPEGLRSLAKEGAVIDPGNKDTIISAISHWLVELGEVDATFRRSDIAHLKAFISQSADKVRLPYARRDDEYPRRTVFFASVNERDYLVDDTGNTRWWTIPVRRIDYAHGIDMQQLWSEVLTLFRAGERWWLDGTEEARLEEINGQHRRVDPIEELILGAYDKDAQPTRRATAAGVLREIGFDRPTTAQARTASAVLKRVWGEPKTVKGRKVFHLPYKEAERPF